MPPTSNKKAFLHSQLLLKLPIPTHKFTGQTIIITGSNIGMGLEAARHFVHLDAAKVILAVRTIAKGEAAKTSIETSTKRLNVVEIWELDLASYDSVKTFAEKAKGLERLDIVVENAGIFVFGYEMKEEDESTITVNVVSTLLLGLLLMPKLRETARTFGIRPVLTVTGSFTHEDPVFVERQAEKIFDALDVKEKAEMSERYQVSKLIQLFCIRELAARVTKSGKEQVLVSTVNPGFVDTAIMRHANFVAGIFIGVMRKTMARTAEEGGRTLIHAAEGDPETHGEYLDDCKVGQVSAFVRSEEGAEVQKRIWAELSVKLEKIQPGIMSNI